MAEATGEGRSGSKRGIRGRRETVGGAGVVCPDSAPGLGQLQDTREEDIYF